MIRRQAHINPDLREILAKIERADDFEINAIITAITTRYQTVFPDWEICFLSLPKNDSEKRRQTIQFVLDSIERSQ